MLVCILECITVGWIYGTYYINDGCLISSRNLIFVSIWVHLLYVGGSLLLMFLVFYVCVVYFVCLRSVYCIQCLQLPIPGCPVGFLCLCCVFCLSSFCVLYPMFTAAHSWLSRRVSMFVLCILFVFVLCIVSNVYSCPFLVVPSVFYVCVVYFVCFRSVYCIQCLQLPIPGCPVGWLSMFVLCILFVFVLCIVSNVSSCPFLVFPSVFSSVYHMTYIT
jgi:hypothetical protein